MRVAVIMGSTSDLPKVEPAIKILKDYGVQVDVRCLSAHRAHAGLSAFIEEANGNGTEVFITAAGMAAALPGVVASQRFFRLSVFQSPVPYSMDRTHFTLSCRCHPEFRLQP